MLSVELLERAFGQLSDGERQTLLEAVDSLLRADDSVGALPLRRPTHGRHLPGRKDSR